MIRLPLSTLFLTLTVLSPAVLPAQDKAPDIKTLFGNDHTIEHGGWGAPSTNYTRIMGQDALLVGVRGGWLIDHRVTLGIAGHGLVTDVPNKAYDEIRIAGGHDLRKGSQLRMGYGGLLIEPIIAHRSAVHVTLPIIIGAGGCVYETYEPLAEEYDPLTDDQDDQAFFVVEPGIELEMNLIKLVRLGIGASYRYTTDITLPGTPTDALRGFNTGVTIKIGSF